MKYSYDKSEFINDFNDYVFQRLESAYGDNESLSITQEENYFTTIERIKGMLSEDEETIIGKLDELEILIDKYVSNHFMVLYRIAFLDGLTTKKEITDPKVSV